MKRHLAAAFAAVAAISLTTACTASSGSADHTYRFTGRTKVGTVIPQAKRQPVAQYSGRLLDGRKTTLAAQSGTVTVINFWGAWCAPCQIETPQFGILSRELKPRGVHFVGIDFHDSADNATSFLRKHDVQYPNFFDKEGEAQLRLGNILSQGPPFTLVLDRHRAVAAVYIGIQSDVDMRRSIDTLLAEK